MAKHFLLISFYLLLACGIHARNQLTTPARRSAPCLMENKGQITDQHGTVRNDIDFKLSAGHGLNLFMGKGQLHYQWVKAGPQTGSPAPVEMYRLDVKLIGANPNAVITFEEPLGYCERYYLPSVNLNGVVSHCYGKATYHDIYPGIDWVLYINADGQLEHDFRIRQGAKVSDIRLQYGGASDLKLTDRGELSVTTPFGAVNEHAPIAYQQGNRKKVPSAYTLDKDILGFSVGDYKGTLVIDPVIEWATYFGGLDYEDANDVELNKDGFIYIVGSTSSTANIATTGAYQTSFAGGSWPAGADAYLARFDQQGSCIWSTYYGGNDIDLGKKITADTSGNLYMAGSTASFSGIATTGSYQAIHAGALQSNDAFLVKFDTSGQRIWGTYFGGSSEEANSTMDVVADRFGSIYLTANTESSDLPVTPGAHQGTLTGYDNTFLAGFNTTGQLIWSTYYGGESADFPYGLAADTAGNIFMTGRTQSSTGIATTGTQQTMTGGGQDAFLAKFSPLGTLLWGTYYGGTALDRGYAVALDDSAHVYIAGTTASTIGMATAGAQQTVFGGGGNSGDGFIARFTNAGIIDWATYYGGSGGESVFGLRYNANGSLYLTGVTTSNNNISTTGSLQPANAGGQDVFIARINAVNGSLLWGSYYGGTDFETGASLDGDTAGNIYVCGKTTSGAGIATAGSYQPVFAGGDNDGFLLHLKDCVPPGVPDSIAGSQSVCSGTTQHYSASAPLATAYTWIFPSGWSGNSNTGGIDITFNGTGGVLKVVAVNDCAVSDTVSVPITVLPLPDLPQIVQNGNVLSTDHTYTSYQWNKDGQPVSGATGATYTITANGSYSVTVSNANGCTITSDPVSLNVTATDDLPAKNGITIFPNPASHHVFIKLPLKATASISNVQGQVLQIIPLGIGLNAVDMSAFAAGVYVLRLNDQSGFFLGSQKIILTRE